MIHARRTLWLLVAAASLVAPAQAQDEARGVLRAIREATLAAPLSARVAELPLREGDRFAAGDLLVGFGCDARRADWRAAGADARGADITLQNGLALQKRGAIGALEIDSARVRLDRARAVEDGLAASLADCRLEAPFAGRVAELRIRRHETPAAGAALVRIVDDSHLEFDLIVPSSWLARLAPGQRLRVRVDDAGTWGDAVLTGLPAAVDPVSQTARVTGAILAPGPGVLPGMAVTAVLPLAGG